MDEQYAQVLNSVVYNGSAMKYVFPITAIIIAILVFICTIKESKSSCDESSCDESSHNVFGDIICAFIMYIFFMGIVLLVCLGLDYVCESTCTNVDSPIIEVTTKDSNTGNRAIVKLQDGSVYQDVKIVKSNETILQPKLFKCTLTHFHDNTTVPGYVLIVGELEKGSDESVNWIYKNLD